MLKYFLTIFWDVIVLLLQYSMIFSPAYSPMPWLRKLPFWGEGAVEKSLDCTVLSKGLPTIFYPLRENTALTRGQ